MSQAEWVGRRNCLIIKELGGQKKQAKQVKQGDRESGGDLQLTEYQRFTAHKPNRFLKPVRFK